MVCLESDEDCQRRASKEEEISRDLWHKVINSLKLKLLQECKRSDGKLSDFLEALRSNGRGGLDLAAFETVCEEAYFVSIDLKSLTTRVLTEESNDASELSVASSAMDTLLGSLAGNRWRREIELSETRPGGALVSYGGWSDSHCAAAATPALQETPMSIASEFYDSTLVERSERSSSGSPSASPNPTQVAAAALSEIEARQGATRCARAAEWSALSGRLQACATALYPLIVSHSRDPAFSADLSRERALRACSDLSRPHEWYPAARLLRRKVVYHGGPTNSGKTYRALQALRRADPEGGGGVFCGPLRLLALEVFEELNREGVYCSLATGQERKDVPFAHHLSCTIEMVNVNKVYDVAVVDEIQMMGDPTRGHAWTRAFLGLQAREVHVCGSLEAEQLVRSLCQDTGDEFEVVRYERMSPMAVMSEPLGDYRHVRPGDCVVAFSKADIFRTVEAIERLTPHKCCVVYGQLPPETRSTQARLFNDPESGYDVLVASDAIGMGLNLNIGRVVFHTTEKIQSSNDGPSNGSVEGTGLLLAGDEKALGSPPPASLVAVPNSASGGEGNSGSGGGGGGGGGARKKGRVEASMMKQIAGRAGRRSSQFQGQGLATCLKEEDLPWLKEAIAAPVKQVEAAGLFPAVEHLQMYSDLLDSYQSTPTTPMDPEAAKEREVGGGGGGGGALRRREAKAAPAAPATTSNGKKKQSKLSKVLSSFMQTARFPPPPAQRGRGATNPAEGAVVVSTHERSGGSAEVETGCSPSAKYFVCRHDEPANLANRLHDVMKGVSVTDAFTFCMAPVRVDDPLSFSMLSKFAEAWANQKPAALNIRFSPSVPKDVVELSDLCTKHNIIDLYLWLSNRFPGHFVEREQALAQKAFAITLIQQGLERLEVELEDIAKLQPSYLRRQQKSEREGSDAAAADPLASKGSSTPGQSRRRLGRKPEKRTPKSSNAERKRGGSFSAAEGRSQRPLARVLRAPKFVSAYQKTSAVPFSTGVRTIESKDQ